MPSPNEILEASKDKFAACVVFGIDENGTTKLMASVDNAAFAHWMLNKAAFELCLYEKSITSAPREKAAQKAKNAKPGKK